MHYSSHMNFGSQEIAEELLTLVQRQIDENDWNILDSHPDWEYVSSGSFRDVYLHVPTQVVYKYQSWRTDDADDMGNEQEHQNAAYLRMLVWQHVYIPRTALFWVNGIDVLAMEYVKGESVSGTHAPGRMELFLKGGLGDMHNGNYFAVGDHIVPVDLGSPMNAGMGDRRPPDRRLINGW